MLVWKICTLCFFVLFYEIVIILTRRILLYMQHVSVCLYLKLCHNHPANCDINIVICCLAKMANNFLESSFCPHCLPPMAQSIFILSFGIFARYKYFVKCGLDITTLSAVVRHRTASKETKLFQVKNTNIVNFLKNKTY